MSRVLVFASIVPLALAACSHKPPVDPATSEHATCQDAAGRIVSFMDKTIPADKATALLVRHCVDDKWTLDLRRCVAAAHTEQELDPCESKFDQAQLDAFRKDLDASGIVPRGADPVEAPPVPPAAQ